MKNMAKMSEAQLKKRKAELGRQARKELAKTEIMRFRLEPRNILHLYEIAEQKHQHVGSMVRQWVLERMEAEASLPVRTKSRAFNVPSVAETTYRHSNVFSGSKGTSDNVFNMIVLRLESLEADVKRLSRHK
jgi:hypothetical protein